MRHLFAMQLALVLVAFCSFGSDASEGSDDLVKLAKSGADTPTPDPVVAGSPGFEQLIKLLKLGAEEEIVLGFISTPPTASYDFTAAEMQALKDAGASPKIILSALDIGNASRAKAALSRDNAIKETDAAIEQFKLRDVVRNPPNAQYILKDKSGKEFALSKWTREATTLFLLYENKQAIKAILAGSSTVVPAEYKTEEKKIEVTPQRTVQKDGKDVIEPAVYTIKPTLICVSPEKVEYAFQNQAVLTIATMYDYVGLDKIATRLKQGTVKIGAVEYEIVPVAETPK